MKELDYLTIAIYKFKQLYLNLIPKDSDLIINFLVKALYILKNGLNIESDDDNELDIFLKQISMNNDRNF